MAPGGWRSDRLGWTFGGSDYFGHAIGLFGNRRQGTSRLSNYGRNDLDILTSWQLRELYLPTTLEIGQINTIEALLTLLFK